MAYFLAEVGGVDLGESRSRRERFFAANPICCFCGGEAAAVTIDHIPPRAAFARRVGPEGFEFPSCEACNHDTAGSEQIFSLYVRVMDRNTSNYDKDYNIALIQGISNNYPHLLPELNLSANRYRRILRQWGWDKPRHGLLSDASIVAIPGEVKIHIEIVGLKLLAALYYRHKAHMLTPRESTLIAWSQQGLPGVDEALNTLAGGFPELVVGQRINTSIGDQFAYRWGENPKEGLFGIVAGFGGGLLLIAASAPASVSEAHEEWRLFEPPRLLSDRAPFLEVN